MSYVQPRTALVRGCLLCVIFVPLSPPRLGEYKMIHPPLVGEVPRTRAVRGGGVLIPKTR